MKGSELGFELARWCGRRKQDHNTGSFSKRDLSTFPQTRYFAALWQVEIFAGEEKSRRRNPSFHGGQANTPPHAHKTAGACKQDTQVLLTRTPTMQSRAILIAVVGAALLAHANAQKADVRAPPYSVSLL